MVEAWLQSSSPTWKKKKKKKRERERERERDRERASEEKRNRQEKQSAKQQVRPVSFFFFLTSPLFFFFFFSFSISFSSSFFFVSLKIKRKGKTTHAGGEAAHALGVCVGAGGEEAPGALRKRIKAKQGPHADRDHVVAAPVAADLRFHAGVVARRVVGQKHHLLAIHAVHEIGVRVVVQQMVQQVLEGAGRLGG